MKIININPGILPIPPNGWGAIEKIIWDYHQEMLNIGLRSEIKYTDEVKYDDSCVVHVHVANLANLLHERGVPYIFTIHDHHAYLYGKDSQLFKENLKAIENSVFSLSPCKYLVPYFGSKKLRYFSHAVNTDIFTFNKRQRHKNLKLLCVANNGYAYDQSIDRKGFKIAIQAAKTLGLPITIAGPRNNDNFFKTLEPELNNYTGLTKLYDLDEKWLTHLYNENDAFLHFSELEAGHPNLTLLEAMASGLPVIGTFEESTYKGMAVCKRDLDEAIAAIKNVDENYDKFRADALFNARSNSYRNRVHELVGLYSEYRERIFANKIILNYELFEKTHKEAKNKINVSFPSGPKVEILGPVNKKYRAKFIDLDTGNVVYESILNNNMWACTSKKYYGNWKVEVYEIVSENWETLVDTHILDMTNKPVKVVLETSSLGDLMAYIGAVDTFQKKHNCKLTCVVYHDEVLELFRKNYSNINFSRLNDNNDGYYATYTIGYFDQNNWEGNVRENPRKMSLAVIAQSILGLPEVEIPPTFKITPNKSVSKYVCIGTQSTAQAKYWNNPDGWKTVVEYIKSKGYEVWCIDLHSSYGNGKYMNYMPYGVVDKTGKFSLEERLSQIAGAEFFIGLGSGLSWLSWAARQRTILISGFSEEFAEFNTPYRIINKNVCHGCWNDNNCTFDKGDWKWCPRNKDFECTKKIYPQDVINVINKIIDSDSSREFEWGIQSEHSRTTMFNEFFGGNTQIYEKFFNVEENDVVLDIGAHVGAFIYSIKHRKPSKVVAVEPSKVRVPTLIKNVKSLNSMVLNCGVGAVAEKIKNGLSYDGITEDMDLFTFDQILSVSKLSKIDFLKIDCEGGEYSVFSEKNMDWIVKNVRKIAGEWHFHGPDKLEKLNSFRRVLSRFKKYEILSVDLVDIKWCIDNDAEMLRYSEFLFYIDNR
jgi:autotransporter strand-loop-strand O-heptosyltransferase